MIQLILERLANAVVALWYPIKDERTLVPWLARAERSAGRAGLDPGAVALCARLARRA